MSTSRVVEAVPPVLEGVRARPPDTTTTELVVGYAVRGTSGTLYYAVAEVDVTTKGGKVWRCPYLGAHLELSSTCLGLHFSYRSLNYPLHVWVCIFPIAHYGLYVTCIFLAPAPRTPLPFAGDNARVKHTKRRKNA